MEKPLRRAAPSVRCLPSSLKTLGRSLGKKNRAAFARHALKDTGIKKNILLCLGKDIQKELGFLCSKKHQSVFRECTAGKTFSYKFITVIICTCHIYFRQVGELQLGCPCIRVAE